MRSLVSPIHKLLLVVVVPSMDGVITGPQGLNVISSIAISLPGPPMPLFRMLIMISVTLGGTVNEKRGCIQSIEEPSVIGFVLYVANG
ncbi:hypothetical protein D3C80_1895840 [compost metagenome]